MFPVAASCFSLASLQPGGKESFQARSKLPLRPLPSRLQPSQPTVSSLELGTAAYRIFSRELGTGTGWTDGKEEEEEGGLEREQRWCWSPGSPSEGIKTPGSQK